MIGLQRPVMAGKGRGHVTAELRAHWCSATDQALQFGICIRLPGSSWTVRVRSLLPCSKEHARLYMNTDDGNGSGIDTGNRRTRMVTKTGTIATTTTVAMLQILAGLCARQSRACWCSPLCQAAKQLAVQLPRCMLHDMLVCSEAQTTPVQCSCNECTSTPHKHGSTSLVAGEGCNHSWL